VLQFGLALRVEHVLFDAHGRVFSALPNLELWQFFDCLPVLLVEGFNIDIAFLVSHLNNNRYINDQTPPATGEKGK
jgi:hypothetical protein